MPKDPVCGMSVSEKKGLKLAHKGKTYFFCSQRCLKKFAEENKIPQNEILSCNAGPFHPVRSNPPWADVSSNGVYRNKTFIVTAVLVLLVLLSYQLSILVPFRKTLLIYFKTIWWAILLGIFLGGVIDHFVPHKYMSHILAKPKKRTVFYSVVLGFFMSVCSHGILALTIQLHKKGASTPAVVAFLLASPWANMTLTIMLIGFFGLKAFYIIISAIVIAITTGLIFQVLERNGLIEKNSNTLDVEEDFSIRQDIKKRLKNYKFSMKSLKQDIKGIYQGMLSLGDMILWWILIGMGLASLAGAYIPSHIFNNYMGPTIAGLFVTLLAATIIEVCSEGSAPMAFELFRQTGALGNSFVFLMAGVVTDYTEIGLLWHNVGRKTAIWLPIVTVPQVIVLGIAANMLF